MQSKKVCTGVSLKTLQNKQKAEFVVPKVSFFLLKKNIKNFLLKRMQGIVYSH